MYIAGRPDLQDWTLQIGGPVAIRFRPGAGGVPWKSAVPRPSTTSWPAITSLAGALNARTGRLTWVEWDRKDSTLFVLQLWRLVGRDYPKAKCIHLILDNYRIHKSVQTEAALARLNGRVVLHFLPPYCPDHNRIERVWRDLHANVTRNHQCPTLNELMAEVRHYLKKRDRQLQRQYSEKQAA